MTAPAAAPVSALPWAVNQARTALAQAVTVTPDGPLDIADLAASNARLRETLTTLLGVLDAHHTT